MKTFIVILAVCVACTYASTLKAEQKAQWYANQDACIKETNVDRVAVEDIVKGHDEIIHTKTLDCFGSCMLKKMGIQHEDGSINIKDAHNFAMKTNANIQKADQVIEECAHYVGKDACDTGGHVFTCFLRNKSIPVLD